MFQGWRVRLQTALAGFDSSRGRHVHERYEWSQFVYVRIAKVGNVEWYKMPHQSDLMALDALIGGDVWHWIQPLRCAICEATRGLWTDAPGPNVLTRERLLESINGQIAKMQQEETP